MTLARRVLGSAFTIGSGQVVSQVLSLVRNAVVARLIGPDDWGIAVTFAIAMSLMDLLSDIAVDRLLVQAPDGEEPRFQGTAQAIQIVRGCALALGLVALAGPIASLFQASEHAWAYRVLALVPLARCLRHLGIVRVQRQYRFAPYVLADVVAQCAGLCAGVAVALIKRDFSAALWSLITYAAAFSVLSHLLAREPFRVSWDGGLLRRFVAFGWPLMLNGLMMFIGLQSDKIIIGAAFENSDLGVYGAAFLLAMGPAIVLAKLNRMIALPTLSECGEDRDAWLSRYRTGGALLAASACGMGALLILGGTPIMRVVYGDDYIAGGALLSVLGAAQASRAFRSAPSVAAMSKADSKNLMMANLVRLLAVPVMIWLAVIGEGLVAFAFAALAGELVSFVVATQGLSKRHGMPVRLSYIPGGAMLLVFALCGLLSGVVDSLGTGAGIAFAALGAITSAAAMLLLPGLGPATLAKAASSVRTRGALS